MIKPSQPRLWRERENKQTGLRPMEMHPYPRLRRYFPRRGKSALHSAVELISISMHSTARISPSGGDAAAGGRRGAFPSRQRRGCMVFPDRRAVVCFSLFPTPARAVVWFYHKGAPSFLRGAPSTAFAPAASAATTLGPCVSTGPYAPLRQRRRPLREYRKAPPRRLVFIKR